MQIPLPDSAPDGTLTGFRLHRLEVYNWGTFGQKIWTMSACGHTALLTGANGAGKSTLVDGLLTLLVPFSKRNYNQAAGQKRERDERSYVLGAYGKVRDDENFGSKVQYLRGKDSYSVLLGYFYNAVDQQAVTLAQVFWVDSAIQKIFVVATVPLSIQDHFSRFETTRQLKERLGTLEGVELPASFSHYSRRFRKLFGLRSDKALDLFSQTVTIKEVGNLNHFVRTHMLEKTDAAEKIDQLLQNYDNLNRAHEAIIRAREQLKQLRPLTKLAHQFQQVEQTISELQECLEFIPVYFAGQKLGLLEREIARIQAEVTQADHRHTEIARQVDELRQQQRSLDIALANDDIERQVAQLSQAIAHQQERGQHRRRQVGRYNQLVEKLGLTGYRDEAAFQHARQQATRIEQGATGKIDELEKEWRSLEMQRLKLKEQGDELDRELDSLRQRRSQIPFRSLELRRRILDALKIDENETPFVGELLQVKVEEKIWEGAIERLLHGFGLQLLVPERHYQRVSQYVNQNHLGDRLVFQRVSERLAPVLPTADANALVYKLDIKPNTAFAAWLGHELVRHYDYICCEDLAQFRREKRAITPAGFIKRGDSLHEKDDRYDIHDRRRYVLGWTNQDKIRAIEAELERVRQNYSRLAQSIQAAEREKKTWETRRKLAQDILQFDEFAEIDWQPVEAEIRSLEAQRQALEQSSDHYKQLKAQHDAVTERLKQAEQAQKQVEQELFSLSHYLQDYQRQHREVEAKAREMAADKTQRHAEKLERNLRDAGLTLQNVDQLQRAQAEYFQRQVNELYATQSEVRGKVEKLMDRYKRDYPTETDHVDASVAAIEEFERMLATIERDDLPRHEKGFKEMLNDKVVNNIVSFKSALEADEAEIRENIVTLNQSLRHISYSPANYIQLEIEPNRDVDVREFRHMLTACLPDWANPDYEASYREIKTLIDRFQTDERWTTKVTDVRNWLDFSASEKYREDDSEKHHYSDSSGKSGGQKAKLAYTILASAIAYQYNLEHGQPRAKTFRLVVVDEAFSKSDEINARYAMELFKNLELQLLVVTPPKSTDIHIVEDYISAVHFVTNTEAENDSRVYNLTMAEYQQKKQEWAQAA
ncbi:MAG TPA: SbcC/MukB-like Walker B domain-containing protein [Anaerolineae bacterium]|nr:SbcC/MukB-like Walker B domain-containing protein [Anaerolineae bacterium]